MWRGLIRAGLLAGLMPVLTLMVSASPAQATSCVGWPDDVSDQIVHGRLPKLPADGSTEAFTKRYDYAVIGTVTAIRQVRSGETMHAEAQIDVRASLFRSAESLVTLQMTDLGAMYGYPFRVGHTYLIPVQARGDQGLRNFVTLCNPVRELANPEIASLLSTARASGVAVTERRPTATTSGTPPTLATAPAASQDSSGSRLLWVIGGAATALMVAGAAVLVWRRRDSGPREASAAA